MVFLKSRGSRVGILVNTIKSAGTVEGSNLYKKSSAMLVGVEIDLRRRTRVIIPSFGQSLVIKLSNGRRVGHSIDACTEIGRAKHSSNLGNHTICYVVQKLSEIGANLGMWRESIGTQPKWRFQKISMNFKAKRSSFSRIFSLFTLDGYGKVVLALGMTTGSSTWTIGGWTSLVLPLGSTVSFVTSVSTSTTGSVMNLKAMVLLGREPEVEVRSLVGFMILLNLGVVGFDLVVAFSTVLVLVPTILLLVGVVLYGGNPGGSDWFASVADGNGISLVEIGCLVHNFAQPLLRDAGSLDWMMSACREVELNHIFQFSTHREILRCGSALLL
ncbi:hypothetical protein Tco_1554019 [Tanacetum coccineum]